MVEVPPLSAALWGRLHYECDSNPESCDIARRGQYVVECKIIEI